MEHEPAISIEFDDREQHFLSFVFVEVFGGGSTGNIQRVLGPTVAAARELQPIVEEQAKSGSTTIELTEVQWRVMYEAIHAVLYGLGPPEFQTCTGMWLTDAANISLRICVAVWGVYGSWRWVDTTTSHRKQARDK